VQGSSHCHTHARKHAHVQASKQRPCCHHPHSLTSLGHGADGERVAVELEALEGADALHVAEPQLAVLLGREDQSAGDVACFQLLTNLKEQNQSARKRKRASERKKE
jgi:hypothetical protein